MYRIQTKVFQMNSFKPARRVLALGIISVVMAGCAAVGPNYVAPNLAPVALQEARDPSFSSASPVGAWWSQFDDPVLDKLVRTALSDNLDIRIALTRVRQARAVFVERSLDRAPHVTLGGSFDRRHQQTSLSGDERSLDESYSLGFDAGWEIDLFGRVRRAEQAARAGLEAQQASLEDVHVVVAAEVARNYFELRGTQRRLAVAQDMLQNLRDTVGVTEARWQTGAGSELDVRRSRAQLYAVEADVPLLQATQVQLQNRLAVLLGQRPNALQADLIPRSVPAYAKALPLGDVTELLRRRPDVRAAERRLAAATAQVGVATADLFPRVRLDGFVGFVSGDAGNLLTSLGRAWALTPSIRWAAFDLGSVRARLRATQAQADGALAEYEHSVLLALEDTENALNRYVNQQRRLLHLVEQAHAMDRAEQLAQIRYREGFEDYLSLLDTQRAYLQSADALAQSEAAVNVGAVAIYKALGGGRSDLRADSAVASADAAQ